MSIKTRKTPAPDYTVLGKEFARLRTAQGYTQYKVAAQTGISESQVSRIERANGLVSISFDQVVRLCNFYKVPLSTAACMLGFEADEEATTLKSDWRLRAISSLLTELPPEKADMYLEIMYRAAAALTAPAAEP